MRTPSSILSARLLMRKQTFVIFIGFFIVTGCGSATFSVATVDASTETDVTDDSAVMASKDAGTDAQDATPLVCEPYSCKPGCGDCDSGTQCGNGGTYTCGSTNCSYDYQADAAGFSCPSGMTQIYTCAHYYGKNTQDFLPRCLFRKGTTADGDYTQWCCPQ